MYRLWGKIMKNNKFVADHVFEIDGSGMSRKEKMEEGIETLCYHFDLQRPMWFSDNEKDFAQFGKARFSDQHFIEDIAFDYFEVEIIEDR